MPHRSSLMIVLLLIVAALQLSACNNAPSLDAKSEEPVHLETVDGSEFNRVILTQKAAERLDIQTEAVGEQDQQLVVPYAAVLYGLNGETWVYTNPESLTYVRALITVDFIEGDEAVLTDGPPAGTEVVMTGAQMLLGADTGVGK